MASDQGGEDGVTELLLRWNDGDGTARDQLMELVQVELRRVAGRQLSGERSNHTLQPTALVNEAYLRLIDQNRVRWQNRAHFFAIAARLMRRILVDHARRQRAGKRGGGALALTLSDAPGIGGVGQNVDLVLLDDALAELAEQDPRMAEVVELRFFGGLTVEETAEALSLSTATVKREWSTARAWLYRRMTAGEER